MNKKENFDNCKNTPEIYKNVQEKIKKNTVRPLLGYTPNNYIYKTFIMKSDDPLPVNSNYWFHEY